MLYSHIQVRDVLVYIPNMKPGKDPRVTVTAKDPEQVTFTLPDGTYKTISKRWARDALLRYVPPYRFTDQQVTSKEQEYLAAKREERYHLRAVAKIRGALLQAQANTLQELSKPDVRAARECATILPSLRKELKMETGALERYSQSTRAKREAYEYAKSTQR